MAPSYSSPSSSISPSSSPPRVNIKILAKNCLIPHSSLKPIHAPFNRCMLCMRIRGDGDFLLGECYSQMGTVKQDIILCSNCLLQYEQFSNYLPKLVVFDKVLDKLERVENSVMNACRAAAIAAASSVVKSESSLSSESLNLDFYDIVGEAFHSNPDVQSFFNHDIRNVSPDNKKTWPLRYKVWRLYKF